MENNHKDLTQILLDIQAIKGQLGRLVSDAGSEKGTRKRITDDLIIRIHKVEDDTLDILYGKDRISGLVIEVALLKNESKERKGEKRGRWGLYIAVGGIIVKEIIEFFTNKN